MRKVYTRPTSASDFQFFLPFSPSVRPRRGRHSLNLKKLSFFQNVHIFLEVNYRPNQFFQISITTQLNEQHFSPHSSQFPYDTVFIIHKSLSSVLFSVHNSQPQIRPTDKKNTSFTKKQPATNKKINYVPAVLKLFMQHALFAK
jgi:hypothetical protein